MAFTVNDIRDLTQLLTLHPEWRAEVRRLVLTDELLALPDLVRELVEAQKRAEPRLDRLDATVQKLIETQMRTEQRLDALAEAQVRTEARLEALTARVDTLTARVDALTVRLESLTAIVQDLVKSQQQIVNTMSGMKGRLLEQSYRERAVAYFGHLLRRPQVVSINDVWEMLESRLSRLEFNDVLALDLIVRGHPREQPDLGDVWLAVEVSAVIDQGDVERAQRRASLLRKAGLRAVPLVAGEALTQGATDLVRETPVVLLLDGRSDGWEAALAALTS